MLKVKIVGAGGYGGVGAVEILSRHPEAELTSLVDVAEVGRRMSDLYPHLDGVCDLPLVSPDQDDRAADVVFFSTPDGVGMSNVTSHLDSGARVVDYSGDFRFNTVEAYAEYATRIGRSPDHACPEILADTAYGLCELHRSEIARAAVVGNPGCFAVSAILGATPAVKHGLVDPASLIFDAKTGVSGAGKKANSIFHYPHRYEEMNAYKIAKHQHVMEVERELGILAGEALRVTFTTQVVPVVRGIMTCCYAALAEGVSYDALLAAYRDFYEDEPFVTVVDESRSTGNRAIRGSNRCALWVNMDRRSGRMIVVSHIDNLLKGQAGSAVQNMNVMFGLEESVGLDFCGAYP